MASQSTEEQLKYVLTVLKHTELPQPNYHGVAEETGAANANNAQKKFKAIIESAGYALANKQIIDPNAPPSEGTAPSTPVKSRAKKSSPAKSTPKKQITPKTPKTPNAPRSTTKKRKVEEIVEDSETGENGEVDNTKKVKPEEHENGEDDTQTIEDEI